MESSDATRVLVVSALAIGVAPVSRLTVLQYVGYVFYSLKNHGADELVDEMFEMGAETMNLPLEEKMQFEQGDGGSSFG